MQNENEQLRQGTTEIVKLRAEVARLRIDSKELAQLKSGSSGDSMESTAKGLANRVAQLKQRLEQMPGATIPELKLLNDEDWLTAIKGHPLDTETDYRRALSAIRSAAENKFASLMQKALRTHAQSNNGQFPTDLAQLQPYFESPIDSTILARWEIAPAKSVPNVRVGDGEQIITQKAFVDEILDNRLVIGPSGQGSTDFLSSDTMETLKPVFDAYRTAHNGQWHTDFSQLEPYASTPEQQTALQKMILRYSTASNAH